MKDRILMLYIQGKDIESIARTLKTNVHTVANVVCPYKIRLGLVR